VDCMYMHMYREESSCRFPEEIGEIFYKAYSHVHNETAEE
jgi:hypothetical protein